MVEGIVVSAGYYGDVLINSAVLVVRVGVGSKQGEYSVPTKPRARPSLIVNIANMVDDCGGGGGGNDVECV